MLEIDKKTGLVLEGGGMRGVFTCGVLDYLMDNKVSFPYAIGVSAGACNGLSYMSHQRGRGRYSNIDLLAKYKYIGIRPLIKKRGLIDQQLLFHRFPDRILPYNYKAYAENPARFEMVTTDCRTGRACYWEEKHNEKRHYPSVGQQRGSGQLSRQLLPLPSRQYIPVFLWPVTPRLCRCIGHRSRRRHLLRQ